jgi:hypothetical protein
MPKDMSRDSWDNEEVIYMKERNENRFQAWQDKIYQC